MQAGSGRRRPRRRAREPRLEARGRPSYALEGFVPVAGAAIDWLVEIGVLGSPPPSTPCSSTVVGRSDPTSCSFPRCRASGRRAGAPTPAARSSADRGDIAAEIVARHRRRRAAPDRRRRRRDRARDADRGDQARRRALAQRARRAAARRPERPADRAAARSDSTAVGAALLGGLRSRLWGDLAALPPAALRPAGRAGALGRAPPRRARDRFAEVIGARRAIRAARARRVGSAPGGRRVPVWIRREVRHARHPCVHRRRSCSCARRAVRGAAARAPAGWEKISRDGLDNIDEATTAVTRIVRSSRPGRTGRRPERTRSRPPRSRARSATACRTRSPCPWSPTGRG